MSKESLLKEVESFTPHNSFISSHHIQELIHQHLPDKIKTGSYVVIVGVSGTVYYGKVTGIDGLKFNINDNMTANKCNCRLATTEEKIFFDKILQKDI